MSVYRGANKMSDLYIGATKLKEAYFGATKVYSANIVEEWVNLGSTEYVQSKKGDFFVTLTGMKSSSTLNYLSFVFDAMYASGSMAADIFLINSSGEFMWRSRCHYHIGVRVCWHYW